MHTGSDFQLTFDRDGAAYQGAVGKILLSLGRARHHCLSHVLLTGSILSAFAVVFDPEMIPGVLTMTWLSQRTSKLTLEEIDVVFFWGMAALSLL
jgi:hypothetical protein